MAYIGLRLLPRRPKHLLPMAKGTVHVPTQVSKMSKALNARILIRVGPATPKVDPEFEVLEKAVAHALQADLSPHAQNETWLLEGYTVEFRKAAHGLGVLTIEGGGLAIPFHVIVAKASTRYRMAKTTVRDLSAGRTPQRGMYKARTATTVRYVSHNGR